MNRHGFWVQAAIVGTLQLVVHSSLAFGAHSAEGYCGSGNPFRHLSQLKIAAPIDGSDVWDTFSVRIEFVHWVSPGIDPPEALPSAFDVLLDGDHALQIELKNSSRSFYLIHIPALPEGWHLLQVALRFPGDDEEQSPAWLPPEQDRARYRSMGRERPILVSSPGISSSGHFAVTIREKVAEGWQVQTQRWAPTETAILVVDMWNFHGCRPAMLRARELVGHINRVISAARQRGAFIIHVPSRSLMLFVLWVVLTYIIANVVLVLQLTGTSSQYMAKILNWLS